MFASHAARPLLLAFGFGNLPMLLWLAAAAAPLLIHLWNRRRHREVRFAAMDYLLTALRRQARRIRVEQWLLLALRTAIVVLVVVSTAEPYFHSFGTPPAAGERTLHVFIVDGSLTMATRTADGSRFDRAKRLVAQTARGSSAGDGFALAFMGSRARSIVPAPTLDRDSFLAELAELRVEHGGGDLAGAVDRAGEILNQAESAGFRQSEVYFATDLARPNWSAAARGAELDRRLTALARRAPLTVLDAGDDAVENAAVVSLSAPRSAPLIDRPLSLAAEIKNFGDRPRSAVPVQLWVGSQKVAEQAINLKPRQRASVVFSHRFTSVGPQAVEVRIPDDALNVDDRRYLALTVREQLAVLCVDGKPDVGGPRGAAYYLARALSPATDAERPAIRTDVAAEGALLERNLDAYNAVLLCNVAQFTASEAQVLARYVRRGGGLVFFLGDQVEAQAYNELLAAGQARVLPMRIAGLAPHARYAFDPLGYRHQLVRVFRGQGQAGLLTTPVYRYFRLERMPGTSAKVALGFAGGDPAIVEEMIGRGRSIVVATDGSLSSVDAAGGTPWTNMPVWPSFVPLVQELLQLAVGGDAAHETLVGQNLTGPLDTSEASPRLRLPDGRQVTLSGTAAGGDWTFADTTRSGFYKLLASSSTGTARLFAVNVDPRFCDVARVAGEQLPPELTAGEVLPIASHLPAAAARGSGAVYRYLLQAALVLLLAETSYAWWLGHLR